MAIVKNLMVRAGADFSAITKQANKAKASMSGMQESVSKSCSRMSSAVSGMGKLFGALGVTLSVAAVVSFSKEAKAAYDEQTEASAKLAQVMRNTMGARAEEVKSIEDLIDAQESLGVVDGAVQTEAAQELATYLTMSKSIKTLLPVLNDMIAQQYGIGASAESAVSIATMLGKVMNGQTSALSRYGYTFTTAQEEILKYGTEAQRAAVLAEVVSESVGGMNAALAATPNGRMEQLNFTMGKIQETFGEAVSRIGILFLPALNAVCSVLATLATLANKVSQAFANVFGSGGTAAATTVAYTAAAASGMSDLAEEAEAAGKAAESLGSYGFDTLQKMSGTSSAAGAAESGEASAADVGGGLITETEETAGAAAESVGWLQSGLQSVKDWLDKISALVSGESSIGQFLARLTPAQSALTGIAAAVVVIAAASAAMSGLSALKGLITAVKAGESLSIFYKMASVFKLMTIEGWSLKAAMSSVFGPGSVIAGIAAIVGGAVLAVSNFFSMWENGLNWLNGALMVFGVALVALGAIILGAPAAITAGIAAIVAVVAAGAVHIKQHWAEIKAFGVAAWESVKSAWSAAGTWFNTKIFTPVKEGFKGFINGIISFFEGMVNSVIRGVNTIIEALNTIRVEIPDWVPGIGGRVFGINLPTIASVTIPRLANGAVFEGNDPYLAVVNDQKHGVNVESPLSTIVEAMMMALQTVNLGDDIQVNVRAVFDGQLSALARLLRPYFEADAKRVGNKASSVKAVV